MEILLIALVLGLSIGLQIADIKQRANDRAKLLESQVEAEKAAKALSDLHNSNIELIKDLTNKVNSHEMLIKTSAGHINNPLGKKF